MAAQDAGEQGDAVTGDGDGQAVGLGVVLGLGLGLGVEVVLRAAGRGLAAGRRQDGGRQGYGRQGRGRRGGAGALPGPAGRRGEVRVDQGDVVGAAFGGGALQRPLGGDGAAGRSDLDLGLGGESRGQRLGEDAVVVDHQDANTPHRPSPLSGADPLRYRTQGTGVCAGGVGDW
ncbi:hypothetical protein KNE206_55300 [Kitasatospora sp. NE20-6]